MWNLKENVKYFHEAFNQDEKGEKWKNNSDDDGNIKKRVKFGDDLGVQHINEDVSGQMRDALKALEVLLKL